ncbi:non-canonical purine NTP diphosphatase [Roseimarinus sediminis]|jgi:XTP/dITP diphosphohydrolase|uniref:non-canonical purine NTP diphosphatase n=1 Tax=Roseimarinus sediminis TaxID=1610899 RepID=UPI003D199A47
MMKLVFATNNQHKLEEVQKILGTHFELLSLADIGCNEDIPETAPTLEGNASQKSRYVFEKYGFDCFADDTGLEVEALNGQPGVYSARYAGPQRSSADNMKLLLSEMDKIKQRNARFRTVVSLIISGKEILFEGIVNGQILSTPQGDEGFGYDPVFQPDGYDVSFAQMAMDQKNSISHRGRAIEKLTAYLKQQEQQQ